LISVDLRLFHWIGSIGSVFIYHISSYADDAEIATAIRRHRISESSQWLLEADFRQGEVWNTNWSLFEDRTEQQAPPRNRLLM
jgi:hypothetical protein